MPRVLKICIGPDNQTIKVHNCKIITDMPVLQQTNRDGETTTISTSVPASNLLMPGWPFENSGKPGIMCKFLILGKNLELFVNFLIYWEFYIVKKSNPYL